MNVNLDTDINKATGRATYFQNVVERMLTYWRDHDAVKTIDVAVLDRERDRILKNITLGLDLQPLWPLVKKLVIAFAPYMERRGFWDIWHGVLEQTIRMAQKFKDMDAETTLLAFLARLCQRMSRPEDVVRHYKRVIRLARQSGNRFEEARACSNLGYLYIDGGHWWRSEVLSQHALAIFEELGSDHGLAHTHNHLGLLHMRQLNHDSGEQHLQQACTIWSSMNDEHGLLRGYTNLGVLYLHQNNPSEALNYLNKSLGLAQKLGDFTEISATWINIGGAYVQMGQFDQANELLSQAREHFHNSRNAYALARTLQNLGLSHMHKKQWAEAEEFMNDALRLAQSVNSAEEEIRIRIDISELAIKQNNQILLGKQFTSLASLISNSTFGDVRKHYESLVIDLHKQVAEAASTTCL